METYEDNDLLMGRIDYGGTVNTACLAYVPEAKVGDYVIVHAGFAISVIDEEEAARTLELWDELLECAAEEERQEPPNPSRNKSGDA
jgi:hydrogenase expression/formation protein HypC